MKADILNEQRPLQTNAAIKTALPVANQCDQQRRFFVFIEEDLTIMLPFATFMLSAQFNTQYPAASQCGHQKPVLPTASQCGQQFRFFC